MESYESIFIHSSCIVDEGAFIGKGSKIWHWSHVSSEAVIGKNCTFGQNVYVGEKVIIGNNVKVQNNVSIYSNVYIEDDVFCGPSMVFTNVLNPRAQINRKNEYKNTFVRRGATIGANATIVCGTEVGQYSFIGAGALVNKDILPFALVVGNPAKQIGWISIYGEKIDLPLTGKGSWKCLNQGLIYELEGKKLKVKS